MCAFQSDTPCPNQDATLIAGDDDDDEDAKGFTKICLCINIIIGINNETSNISIKQLQQQQQNQCQVLTFPFLFPQSESHHSILNDRSGANQSSDQCLIEIVLIIVNSGQPELRDSA